MVNPCSIISLDGAGAIFTNPALSMVVNGPAGSISWSDTDVTEGSVTTGVNCGNFGYVVAETGVGALDSIFTAQVSGDPYSL